MKYKYKKNQLFGKRLNVPEDIRQKIYDCKLTFEEYVKYELDDKIPISCLHNSDRKIVEKFGVDKVKNLDWDLINKGIVNRDSFFELLMNVDLSSKDINLNLYELLKDKINPANYSEGMKKVYPNRLLIVEENSELAELSKRFNDGNLSIPEIIDNWSILKDKDLNFCLSKDINNKENITSDKLKQFITEYGNASVLMSNIGNIYELISKSTRLPNNEKKAYVNKECQILLELRSKLATEFITLPKDYLFTVSKELILSLNDKNAGDFINRFGLKSVADFDNENNHFFTKDNMSKLDTDYYYSSGNILPIDKNEHYNHIYTKEELYDEMRLLIARGPKLHDSQNKLNYLNYRNITGEFRNRNNQLFISEQAPEELKKLFYTKSITPQLLIENPEYIQFLYGKDLSCCFKNRLIKVKYSSSLHEYENLYNYISSKINFNDSMKFIMEYSDIFDLVFNIENEDRYKPDFMLNDNIEEVQRKINEVFKKNIIEKRTVYPTNIPQSLKINYPTLFLSDDAPKELKEAFYNRTIDSEFILSEPTYKNHLKNVDLELIYKDMPIKVLNKDSSFKTYDLVSAIKDVFGKEDGFDLMLLYGKYIESVYSMNRLCNFKINFDASKSELLDELDSNIYQAIINNKMKYDENISRHFKDNNPTLFLNNGVSTEIRNKFYNRLFTLNDFNSNPSLLEIFDNTNVVCGFSEEFSWMIPLFANDENFKIANLNRLKIISAYSHIQDYALQQAFKELILEYGDNINLEKIEYVSEVLSRLSLSNSNEIFTFRKELSIQILNSDNPIKSLNKIEDIFIRNNIPTVGKIYSCFKILHPNFEGFNFDNPTISPMLKKSSVNGKKILVFSDLIKSSFGSNNKSINSYLKNIECGSNLYESLKSSQIEYNNLSEEQKQELIVFSKHLATLYNNTLRAKNDNNQFDLTNDVLSNIDKLVKLLSPDGTLDYNLGDRVIRMFCGFSGIDSLEQAKGYIIQKISSADAKNRESAKTEVKLEQGDFIKGVGGITYLRNILQNGSVSKEYLGSSAGSDATPLDTDVSMIMSSDGTLSEKIHRTAALNYGPIWFVLKNDDRFVMSRTNTETLDTKRDTSKMEVFYTGVAGGDHYGIRTGFASSEINYIIMDNYDPRAGLEIATNGFYIPVANKEGKIVFTPEDYDKLRQKMSGLSYYDENKYAFSDNLKTEQTDYIVSLIDKSNEEVRAKRKIINEVFNKSLEELGLHLKTNIDGDLTEGYVELIDTGSTGRGTNKPGDGDFDFMMRLDKSIISNPSKLAQIKNAILKNLGKENSHELIGTGDFRLKSVPITPDINVDIDITFTEKTDKISYSTDMSLQDRLGTIRKQDSEKYRYVVANILLAKQVLKEAEVYKPDRGEIRQGGLGGVGIENWILQNGGSFIDAAKSFVEVSDGKSFQEFQLNYCIWDFGDNHLAQRRGQYPHDNFVADNMSEKGYMKMVETLREYLSSLNNSQTQAQENAGSSR